MCGGLIMCESALNFITVFIMHYVRNKTHWIVLL